VRHEPVTITTNEGRDEFLVLSAEEHACLERRDRRVGLTGNLREEWIDAVRNAQAADEFRRPRRRTEIARAASRPYSGSRYPPPLSLAHEFSHSEHWAGREEGQKDRLCPIVAAIRPAEDAGETGVLALPVTHSSPADAAPAVEIAARVKERCGSTLRARGSSSSSGMK
jgi:hypothetical protein